MLLRLKFKFVITKRKRPRLFAVGRLETLDVLLGYLRFCELSSTPTGVCMHIMCIHMAMAVMRIAFNIVSCFYKTWPYDVKSLPIGFGEICRRL